MESPSESVILKMGSNLLAKFCDYRYYFVLFGVYFVTTLQLPKVTAKNFLA